jgi:CheY-like chemotaxis protein
VVIIEDNRDLANSLAMLLRLAGHEVVVAYSGTEGVELARRLRADVVISDIGLPGLDGLEVARALRREPATRHALLIAITAYAGDEFCRRVRDAGYDHILTKPADPNAVLKLLGG